MESLGSDAEGPLRTLRYSVAQALTVALVESSGAAELEEAAVGCTSLAVSWEALGWGLLARAGVESDWAEPAGAEASAVGAATDVAAVVAVALTVASVLGAAAAVPSLVGVATDVAAVVGAVVAVASVVGAALAVPSAVGAALAAASVVESSVVDSSAASVSSGRSTFSSGSASSEESASWEVSALSTGSTALGAVEFSARADAVTDDEAAGDETAAEGASLAGSGDAGLDDAGLDDAEVAAADGVAGAPRGLTSWVSASPCSRMLGPWLSTRRVPWPSWFPGSGAQPAISPAEAMAATLILSVCADPISPTSFRQANRVRLPEMYVNKVFSDHSERGPPHPEECNTPGAGY